jgi:DHA1 family tetracycline resistance protein-like MFS transporter
LNATYGLLVLPESVARENRRPFSWKRANPVGSLTLLRSHPELTGLAAVYLLFFLAHQSLPSVFVLYTGYRYHWGEQTVGLTLAGVGVCGVIVQGGLVRPIVAKLGERRTLLTGLAFGAVGFAAFALAPTSGALWAAVPVFAFMGLFGPAAQGMMTRRVAPSEQGQLQGANSSLMGITGMIGPGMFTLTFAHFIRGGSAAHLPGAPYLLASMLVVAAWVVAWRVARGSSPHAAT